MITRSLHWRLLSGAAAAILLALVVAWLFMTLLFERHLERRLETELASAPAIAASGQPALGEACLPASRHMMRHPCQPPSAISAPAIRAGIQFITSSVRAAAQPKARQRGSIWPIMLSAVLIAL